MSNQLSILTEINCMWQVTKPFKSIVKNRTEFFFLLFFLSLQPRKGGRRRGKLLTDKTLNTRALQVSSIPLGQQRWYSVSSPEEVHTTTSMQYPTRAYWYCLNNPDSALCSTALSALPGTPAVSCAKHWQKQHVLVRADSSQYHIRPYFVMKSPVHEDTQIREPMWHKGEQAEWVITHSLTNPERAGQAHPKHIHRIRCTSKSLCSSSTRVTDHNYGKSVVKHILSLLKVKPVCLSRHKSR